MTANWVSKELAKEGVLERGGTGNSSEERRGGRGGESANSSERGGRGGGMLIEGDD